jgi:hypothetical protein
MHELREHRRSLVVVAGVMVIAAAVVAARFAPAKAHGSGVVLTPALKELQRSSPGGVETGGPGGESAEGHKAQEQFDNARLAPGGVVAPGAYSAAYDNLKGLDPSGTTWQELTHVPYDADDVNYRDYYSNSSGGSGLVTGRITGLAADDAGHVYAAGADGGVWRSTTGGGHWTAIADALPSLSSGDLELGPDGALWYATGEANTGGTSYAGTGVYRLADPQTASFTPADRVGGAELESTTINSLRFAGGKVWAATLRGIFSHPLGSKDAAWTRAFAPNASYLPGGANAAVQNAAYMNIVNDLVVDPRNANHLLAALGWRSGAAYNGFYESTDGGAMWSKIDPTGGLDATDIGYANFAYSADGSRLYVINQSPRKLTSLSAQPQTYLDGVYVSSRGALAGPWTRIASSEKLGATATGSALANNDGRGYHPGIQAWYNQFIAVDPANANHVYVGLEEVYETTNGGTSWKTVGPYWNFSFGCWNVDVLYPPNGLSGGNGCPLTTHSDQHAVAFGVADGKAQVFVGNDGGVYRRPANGQTNRNGNASDWVSLNDGTINALQYYYVGVGKLQANDATRPAINKGEQVLVSGGLQDNGGSLLRPGADKMVSNFGGDGGDVLVDPNDGCNIVQEYVYLSLRMTKTCANPASTQAWLDLSQATTTSIAPPDINAQFIAPFIANAKNNDQWLAGGNSIWYQGKGFAIKSGSEWQKVKTLASPSQTFTAIAYSGSKALATWCGPCSNSTTALFQRGATVGTFDGTTWTWKDITFPSAFPNRYLQAAAIDPSNDTHMFLGVNGFSRRYTEGPGAGFGHVFESKNAGETWTDISGNLPDIPVNDILVLPSGGLVVATDLGVVYRASAAAPWTRLGGASLPAIVAMDLTLGPDGNIYVGTHGRGIWRISASGL